MPGINPIFTNLRAMAHYLDQPQVINSAHQLVGKRGGLWGFTAALFAYDLLTADPDKRKDVLVRDSLVLGGTAAATKVGLNILSEQADNMPPINGMLDFEKTFKHYPKAFVDKFLHRTIKGVAESHDKAYVPKGLHHMKFNQARGYFSLPEIRQIIEGAHKYGGKEGSNHLNKIFPLPGHDHGSQVGDMMLNLIRKGKFPMKKQLLGLAKDEMVQFFWVGGMIVLAGLAGGLIYDQVAGIKDKKVKVNQIKEGIFQFIANIAMCAVGATVGLTIDKALGLEQKILKNPSKAMALRGARFGLIMAGLSIGIVGGGYIANWFGRRFVNPFFNWLDHRKEGMTLGEALSHPKAKADRKVEFLDAVLHLDDLPTALALAGVQIFVPFIPLFFAVSGWRTGLGYRNKEDGGDDDAPIVQTPKRMVWPETHFEPRETSPAPPKPTPVPKIASVTPPAMQSVLQWPMTQPMFTPYPPYYQMAYGYQQPFASYPTAESYYPQTGFNYYGYYANGSQRGY